MKVLLVFLILISFALNICPSGMKKFGNSCIKEITLPRTNLFPSRSTKNTRLPNTLKLTQMANKKSSNIQIKKQNNQTDTTEGIKPPNCFGRRCK